MAGITNSEIDSIHQQINEFPNIRSDLSMDIDIPLPKTGSINNKRPKTAGERPAKSVDVEAEIAKLETDIEQLQCQHKQSQQQNRLLKAWQQYLSPKRKLLKHTASDVIQAKIASAQHKLDLLSQLTGVHITECTEEVTKRGDLCLTKIQQLTGSCDDVEFLLKMEIQEVMNEDLRVTSEITHLSISASESIYRDLKDTVEILANTGNAQSFLTMLKTYTRWKTARDKTFDHFIETYPDIVTEESDSILHIKHPVKLCVFVIEWKFQVSDIYTVSPDIQLSINVPKNGPNDVLQTAPNTFQLMLKELGIERSIHSLIVLHLE